MKASRMLSLEHRELGRALKILRIEVTKIEEDQEVHPNVISELVYFFREFGDHCHHAKEEAVIFPAVRRFGGELGGKLVEVLIAEHKVGRELLDKIAEANEACKQGNKEAGNRLSHSAVEYATHMAGHMRTENTTLLDLMDRSFTDEEDERILGQCVAIEAEAPQKHEGLEAVLKRLESRFAA